MMEIKKRDNEHGVPVYDLIGLTEDKMFAILNVLDDTLKRGPLTAAQYNVWLAVSRALEMGDLYEQA